MTRTRTSASRRSPSSTTANDLRILTDVEAGTEVALDPELVAGHDPIVDRPSVDPSPVQRLLQQATGVQGFWLLYADYPYQGARPA